MSGIYEAVPASPEEVKAFAESLTSAYLHCRVWGHDPEPHNVVLVRDIEGHPTAAYDASLLCGHGCGVRWRVLVASDGEVLKRSLDYTDAPGYLCEVGRIDKDGRKVLRKKFFVGATKGQRRPRRRS
jgi:hypothetical protein